MKPEIARAPGPQPEPIRVACVRFISPMDAAGLSVASSVSSKGRMLVSYLPWMRHFLIEFTPGDGPVRKSYIHECNAKSWDPA
jgi:hypothetical protein